MKLNLKFVGVAATVVGIASMLLNNFVSSKQIEEAVDEKVREVLSKKDDEEEES